MRWEDERYVRLYTRDTVDWLNLSFEAQALFALLLRKVDRAGLLPLGKHGARGVASAIGHPLRWDTIRPALDELVADGCVTICDGVLFIPNFTVAQDAKQSDKARQQKSRETARALLKAQSVTNRDETSQAVTDGHATSQPVTPCRAVPSSTVPSSAVPPEGRSTAAPAEPAAARPAPEDLQAVWNANKAPEMPAWEEMPAKRREKAKARLKERSLEEWRTVVTRLAMSSFARGMKPGRDGRTWRADPDFLLQPEAATKILEGKYDDDPKSPGPPRSSRGPVRAEGVDWSGHHGGVAHAL